MIAYEELVAALTHWRARNGLPTGAAEYLGEMAPITSVAFDAYATPARGTHDLEDVEEISSGVYDAEPDSPPEYEAMSGVPEPAEVDLESAAIEALDGYDESQLVEEIAADGGSADDAVLESVDVDAEGSAPVVIEADDPSAEPTGGKKRKRKGRR